MSASPAPSDAAEQPKKITFRFCRECSNLLYPKENRATNELRFECRTCRWDEEAPSSCVYRNQMSNAVGETAGITQDIGQDPTVGAPVHETVAHPSQRDSFMPSPPMSPIPDFCTMCGQEIYCETCGEPTDYGCFLEVEDQDVEMGEAPMTGNATTTSTIPANDDSTTDSEHHAGSSNVPKT